MKNFLKSLFSIGVNPLCKPVFGMSHEYEL